MREEDCYQTIRESELPPGKIRTVEVDREGVLLANVDGKFYGIGAYCKHKQWDLAEGALEGTRVTCAGHGTVWDLRTGKGEFTKPLEDEPLYDVQVKDGYLCVKRKS
jgi:nitrite reductase/ring-hydroxylating ferredoxin subunit